MENEWDSNVRNLSCYLDSQSFLLYWTSAKKRRMRIKFHAKHPLIKYHSMINDDTYFSGYMSACLNNDMESELSYVLGIKKSFHLLCHSLSLRKNSNNIYRWFLMRFFFVLPFWHIVHTYIIWILSENLWHGTKKNARMYMQHNRRERGKIENHCSSNFSIYYSFLRDILMVYISYMLISWTFLLQKYGYEYHAEINFGLKIELKFMKMEKKILMKWK